MTADPAIIEAAAHLKRLDWNKCEHEWRAKVSEYDSAHQEDVVCVKCQCPGVRSTRDGSVFWPAT